MIRRSYVQVFNGLKCEKKRGRKKHTYDVFMVHIPGIYRKLYGFAFIFCVNVNTVTGFERMSFFRHKNIAKYS